MNALLLKEYMQLELTAMPEPDIAADEVLIRVRACGICGSDVHGLDGSTGRRIPPLVMGHEAAGEVAALGASVRGLRLGDRVTFDSTIYCGQCSYCARGEMNLCDNRQVMGVSPGPYRRHGAFAEYVAVPRRIVYKLPDALSFEQAALIEAVSVAMHAVNLTPVRLGDTAVVVGAGMIGVLAVQCLRASGCARVIAVDPIEQRLAMARELGATDTATALRKLQCRYLRGMRRQQGSRAGGHQFRPQRRRGDASRQRFANRRIAAARSGQPADPLAGLLRFMRRISRRHRPDGARRNPRRFADQRSGSARRRRGLVRQALPARREFD